MLHSLQETKNVTPNYYIQQNYQSQSTEKDKLFSFFIVFI